MVFPVKRAMASIDTANEESDFKPILNSLPFQELFHLASQLASKSSELTQTRVELERAKYRDELAEVAAQVSHDIQSPLAMLLSLIRNQNQIDSNEQKRLVESATSRLQTMTGDLIKRYRGEEIFSQGGLALVAPLLHCVIEEKKAELPANAKIQFSLDCPSELTTSMLKISEIELARILSNILNNSLNALSDQTSGKISIQISRILDGHFIQIAISDSGIGMTDEVLQKVRTIGGSYNKVSGTGLGLSHAKKSLAACGGKLEIDSVLGKGTVVRLSIPELILPRKKVANAPDLILIDNDENVRRVWELEAQALGLSLIDVEDDSHIELKNIPKETTFFVDNNLSDGRSGIEVCKKLYSLGYQNLFLATGDRGIEKPSFILGIVGKQFPPLFS
jgi:signal transduction histidine kinase